MQVIYCGFLPIITREFYGFSADSDRVPDGLSDGSTDESNDVEFSHEMDFQEILSCNTHGYFHHEFIRWLDRQNG